MYSGALVDFSRAFWVSSSSASAKASAREEEGQHGDRTQNRRVDIAPKVDKFCSFGAFSEDFPSLDLEDDFFFFFSATSPAEASPGRGELEPVVKQNSLSVSKGLVHDARKQSGR